MCFSISLYSRSPPNPDLSLSYPSFTSSPHSHSLFFSSLFFFFSYSNKILPLYDKLSALSSSQDPFPSCFQFPWFHITKVLTLHRHKQNSQTERQDGTWEEFSSVVEERQGIRALPWKYSGLEALPTMCQCPLNIFSAQLLSRLIFWLVYQS